MRKWGGASSGGPHVGSGAPPGRSCARRPGAPFRRAFALFGIAIALSVPAGVRAADGGMAPSFALPGPDGGTHRLEDYRGEVVYVDFWASWCAPCLQSFPWMNAVAERHRADGLRVVAINLDSDREAATRFLADTRADFDIAFDPEGRSAEAYALVGMPSSYVIDRDGRIVHAHVGFRRKDVPTLEAALASALEGDGRGTTFAEAD